MGELRYDFLEEKTDYFWNDIRAGFYAIFDICGEQSDSETLLELTKNFNFNKMATETVINFILQKNIGIPKQKRILRILKKRKVSPSQKHPLSAIIPSILKLYPVQNLPELYSSKNWRLLKLSQTAKENLLQAEPETLPGSSAIEAISAKLKIAKSTVASFYASRWLPFVEETHSIQRPYANSVDDLEAPFVAPARKFVLWKVFYSLPVAEKEDEKQSIRSRKRKTEPNFNVGALKMGKLSPDNRDVLISENGVTSEKKTGETEKGFGRTPLSLREQEILFRQIYFKIAEESIMYSKKRKSAVWTESETEQMVRAVVDWHIREMVKPKPLMEPPKWDPTSSEDVKENDNDCSASEKNKKKVRLDFVWDFAAEKVPGKSAIQCNNRFTKFSSHFKQELKKHILLSIGYSPNSKLVSSELPENDLLSNYKFKKLSIGKNDKKAFFASIKTSDEKKSESAAKTAQISAAKDLLKIVFSELDATYDKNIGKKMLEKADEDILKNAFVELFEDEAIERVQSDHGKLRSWQMSFPYRNAMDLNKIKSKSTPEKTFGINLRRQIRLNDWDENITLSKKETIKSFDCTIMKNDEAENLRELKIAKSHFSLDFEKETKIEKISEKIEKIIENDILTKQQIYTLFQISESKNINSEETKKILAEPTKKEDFEDAMRYLKNRAKIFDVDAKENRFYLRTDIGRYCVDVVDEHKVVDLSRNCDIGKRAIRPWLNLRGEINSELVQKILLKIKSIVCKMPGIRIEGLCKHFKVVLGKSQLKRFLRVLRIDGEIRKRVETKCEKGVATERIVRFYPAVSSKYFE
ncbi:hypothetical protein MHBO_000013 [Bonamia ostreae]|uniref:Myb-like domain-containing protein n=1 Tax=Bonamia ostreae TaxID=126728 RepID=A0ABV2ADY8_9EUKA